MKKVISTCLFGSSPKSYNRYAVNAPKSANFVKNNMPGWNFRLYHDNTVNERIINTLQNNDIVELIEMPKSIEREGCFWRFLAFDDCDVAVCRDLDWIMQANDLIAIDKFLNSESMIHFIWVVHPRKLAYKNGRYYMAGCVGAKNLPFKISNLMKKYTDNKGVFGADEWFLAKHVVPEVLKYQPKIPIYIEPEPKLVPKDKVKEYTEILPDIEEYTYFTENYRGI